MALDGRYKGKAVSVQYGQSGNGTDQVGIGVECTQGPNKGTRSTSILYFSAEAAPYSIKKLRAAGWKGDNLGELMKPGSEDSESGIGLPNWESTEFEYSLTTETYQDSTTGETKSNQKCNIFDGDGGQMVFKQQMTQSDRKAFGERLKHLTAASATPGSSSSGGGGGSDIKL